MAQNVERKLIRAGVLKETSGVRRQTYSLVSSWQSRPALIGFRNPGEFVNRGSQNFSSLGPNEKGREARKREKGPNNGFRNLSYQELMERRAKGLYFKCGQNYSPMHQCPEKELKLVIWE